MPQTESQEITDSGVFGRFLNHRQAHPAIQFYIENIVDPIGKGVKMPWESADIVTFGIEEEKQFDISRLRKGYPFGLWGKIRFDNPSYGYFLRLAIAEGALPYTELALVRESTDEQQVMPGFGGRMRETGLVSSFQWVSLPTTIRGSDLVVASTFRASCESDYDDELRWHRRAGEQLYGIMHDQAIATERPSDLLHLDLIPIKQRKRGKLIILETA